MSTLQLKAAVCSCCQSPYSYKPVFLYGEEIFDNQLCDSCDAKRLVQARADHERSERTKRLIAWDYSDLPLKDTQLDKLPASRGRMVANWKYSFKGPFCHGPSGSGKSRALIALCRRLWVEEKREFKFLSWPKWCDELDSAMKYGSRERERLIEGVNRWPFLVFDDVGKGRPTESHVAAFFRVIDYRTSRQLPTAISTKFELTRAPGSPFQQRLTLGSPDAATDVCRRLVDTSTNSPFVL